MAFSTILKLIVLIEILNISAVYSKVESANEPDKEFKKKPDKLIKEPIKEIKRLKCYTSGPPREESPINMEIMPNETNCFIRPPHPAHPKDTPFCVGFAGRGVNWRHDDEIMGVFKCDDNPFHEAYRYFFSPLHNTLREKMLDNYGPGRATVSLKTHELSMQGEGIIDKISVFKELSDIVKLIDGWSRYEIPETTLTLNSTMALDVDSLKINVLINGPIQFDKNQLWRITEDNKLVNKNGHWTYENLTLTVPEEGSEGYIQNNRGEMLVDGDSGIHFKNLEAICDMLVGGRHGISFNQKSRRYKWKRITSNSTSNSKEWFYLRNYYGDRLLTAVTATNTKIERHRNIPKSLKICDADFKTCESIKIDQDGPWMVEQGILEILSFAMKLIVDCENVILMLDDLSFEMSMDPIHCKDGNLAFLEWKIINEIWPLLIRGPRMDQWARLDMVPNKEFDIDFKFENTGDISAKIKMNGKFTLSKLAELSSLIPELIQGAANVCVGDECVQAGFCSENLCNTIENFKEMANSDFSKTP